MRQFLNGITLVDGGVTGVQFDFIQNSDLPAGSGGGTGTVTSVSVVSANGVSGTVANVSTTPAITLTLNAITPSSVAASGTISGSNFSGSSSGTNTGDQTTVSGSSGSCTGNAATATALQTARTINGVSFDGTANITVTAAAGTLTGTVLNATVTASSLTSVGTLATLTVTATITGSVSGNAATVTTNANLTGPITSIGNATSVAAQTGTGSTFVMQASPTLTTPLLGTPTSGTLTNCTGYAYANLTGTPAIPVGANPTATIGTAAVNGTAATFMRSDGAPAFGNLTGNVTSVGMATTIAAGVVTNAMLAGLIQASKLIGTDIATVGTITQGVWHATAVGIAYGGTGATNAGAAFNALSPMTTVGDMIYDSGGNAERLAGNTTATNKFLTQTGTGINGGVPIWATIAIADVPTLNQNTTGTAANVTGTVAIFNGGTGQVTAAAAYNALSPMTTLGDLEYESAANTASRLAGNTTATKKFLTQTGNGTVSAAPAWGAIVAADVPTLNQSTTGNAATATALQTGRTINGTTFDGTGNITVTAAAGTLTGTVLNATVVTSSLTAVGTIATGVWNGSAIAAAYLPSLDAITAPAADVSLNSHKLTSVTDPASAQDAATKHYVDNSAPLPRGYIDGLVLSTNTATTISIAAGVARDSTNAANLEVTTAWSKSTSAWAAGSTNGGLDTGTIAASTWYKVFIIAKTDGTTDFIYTKAAVATGPAMPTGYTLFRYIGSVRTNGSSHFMAFTQIGDKFIWFDLNNEASGAAVSATFVGLTLQYTPAGISVTAMIYAAVSSNSAGANLAVLSGYADSSQAPGLTPLTYCILGPSIGVDGYASILMQTDATPKIYVGGNSALDHYSLSVLGYIDPRGRDF